MYSGFTGKRECFVVSKATTKAEAIYYTESQERRDIFINSQIDPICIEDIPDVTAKIYHLAGIYYGDYDNSLFTYLSEKESSRVISSGVSVMRKTERLYIMTGRTNISIFPTLLI